MDEIHLLESEGLALVEALGGHWSQGQGMACCPAHHDRTPSLRIRAGRSRLLFHCFAGCSREAILAALLRSGLLRAERGQGHAPVSMIARRSLSEQALRLWDKAGPIACSLAEHYLRGRALGTEAADLRFIARLPLGPTRLRRFAPAMLAAVRDDAGLVAMQRTYLESRDGHVRVRERRALGMLGSGAVRLAPPGVDLGLAEGIETALAATALFDMPCWATLGAARFGRVDVPPGVHRVHLFLDHDEGGRRAEALARAAHGQDHEILSHFPPQSGQDWNDVLQLGRALSVPCWKGTGRCC